MSMKLEMRTCANGSTQYVVSGRVGEVLAVGYGETVAEALGNAIFYANTIAK